MNNDKEGCEFRTQLRTFISPLLKILRKANGVFLEYGRVSFGSNILPKNQLNKTFLHNIPWFSECCRRYMKPHLCKSWSKTNTGILAITDGKFT